MRYPPGFWYFKVSYIGPGAGLFIPVEKSVLVCGFIL